jgi:hypothetical protein
VVGDEQIDRASSRAYDLLMKLESILNGAIDRLGAAKIYLFGREVFRIEIPAAGTAASTTAAVKP